MLAKLIRIILFNFVHFIISVCDFLVNIKVSVYSRWNKHFYSDNDTDIQFLVTRSRLLIRKPNHLIVIFKEDLMTICDVANIIIWTLVTGTPFISIYEENGKIKQLEEKLFLEVEKRKHGVPGCIKWVNQTQLNGFTNGQKPFVTTVTLFDKKDGRETISNFVCDLVKHKIKCEKRKDDYTSEDIDVMLKSYFPALPDPDVVVYCSKACLTHGLLPWQIRLTEFLQIQSVGRVKVQDYFDVLLKFSKCDKRFGK